MDVPVRQRFILYGRTRSVRAKEEQHNQRTTENGKTLCLVVDAKRDTLVSYYDALIILHRLTKG